MKNLGVCVVTGACNQGIGEAASKRLVADGYTVIGTYEPELQDRASALISELSEIELHPIRHAVRKDLAKLVTIVGDRPLRGLINAEMFFSMENTQNFDYDLWERSISVNLTAPNYLIRELSKNFASGTSVVTVTSTEGFVGSFGASAYAASKAAVHNLTKTLANNFGPSGVRVNAVAPGWIGGVMDTDEVFNMSRDITPLGRLGSPEEVASVISFLLSDQAAFISGSVVTVDGGYSGVDIISKYEFKAQ